MWPVKGQGKETKERAENELSRVRDKRECINRVEKSCDLECALDVASQGAGQNPVFEIGHYRSFF